MELKLPTRAPKCGGDKRNSEVTWGIHCVNNALGWLHTGSHIASHHRASEDTKRFFVMNF